MNKLNRIQSIVRSSFSQCIYLLFSLLIYSCGESPVYQISIEAVDYDRPPAPRLFTFPDSLIKTGSPYLRQEGSVKKLPVQRMDDQWVYIPKDTIPAGKSLKLSLFYEEELSTDEVTSVVEDGKLEIAVRDKSVLSYQMKTRFPSEDLPDYYQRGGFIHPAYAPNGQIITDDFPIGHTHQHGIFFAWVNTRYHGRDVDFWNQQDETGTVIFDSLISNINGPVFSEFESAQTAVALDGEDSIKVLAEKWKVRIYNLSDYFVWDIKVHQENISDSTLHILPYHYGGMAFRGSAFWNDTTTNGQKQPLGNFLTSEGLSRAAGNHSRPNWVSMYGKVNNQSVGLAVFGYKKNYRAPQYVRIHPNMPYFCFTPVVEYGLDFNPGDVYSARYRVITFNGDPDPDFIDVMWNQYQLDE